MTEPTPNAENARLRAELGIVAAREARARRGWARWHHDIDRHIAKLEHNLADQSRREEAAIGLADDLAAVLVAFERWDMLSLDPRTGEGLATHDAPWAREQIDRALTEWRKARGKAHR